jgi:Sec-independent protein secretion pathway component TatC
LQVPPLVSISSLVSSLIVAIPVIAYHLCRAASGVRPIDLLDASRRVTPGSTASRFIGPGLLMAEWVPTVACAVAVFSIIALGTAICRKDGYAGPRTAIAIGLSILSGLVAYDTGLLIRGC